MTIEKKIDDQNVTLVIAGRLDTTTAPELEKQLESVFDNVKNLTFDMTELEYISSAGLRILLKAQKVMNTCGSMKLVGVNENIMEIFDITGFLDILTIE
ncbi:MAG: STAS domain-containing protein [Candidatus Coproplasma sp.]